MAYYFSKKIEEYMNLYNQLKESLKRSAKLHLFSDLESVKELEKFFTKLYKKSLLS